MKFREKLKEEYPEKVRDIYNGGCYGCPRDYGYEKSMPMHCSQSMCSMCWDREVSE